MKTLSLLAILSALTVAGFAFGQNESYSFEQSSARVILSNKAAIDALKAQVQVLQRQFEASMRVQGVDKSEIVDDLRARAERDRSNDKSNSGI